MKHASPLSDPKTKAKDAVLQEIDFLPKRSLIRSLILMVPREELENAKRGILREFRVIRIPRPGTTFYSYKTGSKEFNAGILNTRQDSEYLLCQAEEERHMNLLVLPNFI